MMPEPHLTAIFDAADRRAIAACADATGWSAESIAEYVWRLSCGDPDEVAARELSKMKKYKRINQGGRIG